MGRDALVPLNYNVPIGVNDLLKALAPHNGAGELILKRYKEWLEGRQPYRYCYPRDAKHWREYQFRQVVASLDYLSKIMLDK